MAGSTAIKDVGTSLVDVLKARMTDLNLGDLEKTILLASPGELEADEDPALTLFLYRVSQNPAMKNAGRRVLPPPSGEEDDQLQPPPLALDLYYLLTAYPPEEATRSTTASERQHETLGRAMQVFHENSVLRGSELAGSLGDDEELRLSVYPTNEEDLLNVWGTFTDRSFLPSVAYVVSPLEIESTVSEPIPRTRRRVLRSKLYGDAGEREDRTFDEEDDE